MLNRKVYLKNYQNTKMYYRTYETERYIYTGFIKIQIQNAKESSLTIIPLSQL